MCYTHGRDLPPAHSVSDAHNVSLKRTCLIIFLLQKGKSITHKYHLMLETVYKAHANHMECLKCSL